MNRNREENTRCTWFTQIGYVHGVEEFSLIVKGLHKYIDMTSSLEVLFLHLGVVSLTDGDAQEVPQVSERGDLPKEMTDKSIRSTQEFEGQNKSIKSRVRSTLMIWDTLVVHKVVDVKWCTTFAFKWSFRALLLIDSSMRGSFSVKCQYRINCSEVRARAKENTWKKHNMGYSCF
ncbi:hypothetical protein ACFX1S_014977 [Malus domestica]